MIIRFETSSSSVFEINTKAKKIRRSPENILGSWKQYIRISKPLVGTPILIVWAVDDKDAPTKSTITNTVVSYKIVEY